VTQATPPNLWLGGAVQWQNQNMSVPQGVPDAFIAEVLWVTTQNVRPCFVEVGDSVWNDDAGNLQQGYYWAENDATGYHARDLQVQVVRPPLGQFQRYKIAQRRGAYRVFIGGIQVGVSQQPGDTLHVETGVESNNVGSRILAPVGFQTFQIYDENGRWVPWPTQNQDVEAPATWQWSWPTATNGFN